MTFNRPGICDEFLIAAGVEFVTDPESHLRIPYYDREGRPTGHYRIRLKEVRANGQKYDQPAGSGVHVYFPHIPLSVCQRLWVTEGEFKALSMWEAGNPTIGLPGLHCYTRDVNGNPQILPALFDAIRFVQPSEIVFIGDADTILNIEYYRSAHFLATAFPKVAVHLLQVPFGSPQKGIDDLRGALDGEFPGRLEQLYIDAVWSDPEESFLLPAISRLDGLSKVIDGLPGTEQVKQRRRVCQMAAWAKLARDEAQAIVAQLLDAAKGATGFNKDTFNASMEDEIRRIRPEESSKKPDGTTPVPEIWPEPLVHSEVLEAVLGEFLDPHLVVITEAQAIVCAVHTLTTYLTNYIDDWLHFLYVTAGAKASGKTKLLGLFFELSYRADLSGNPSSAAVYYALKDGTYTILIDEVDRNEQHREAVLDLINYSSSRVTAWVSRVNLEKGVREKYCTFCPKILAGNGSIRDTSASRCIKIQMMRKGPGGPRVMIKKQDRIRFEALRSKLMRVATEIGPRIQEYDDIDTLKLPGGLYNREADNWILLFLTAEMVGGQWPKLLQAAYRELCPPRNPDAADDFDGTELGEPLIRDIARIWMETPAQDFYATEALRIKLNTFKDRPWPGLNRGDGLTVEKLSSLLRGFGKKSVKRRLGQGVRHWGYVLKDLVLLFESYAPDIWNPPDPPPDGGGSPDPEPPKPPPEGDNKEKRPNEGVRPGPPDHAPADLVPEPIGGMVQVSEQIKITESDSDLDHNLTLSGSNTKLGVVQVVQVQTPNSSAFSICLPPSTPQAPFLSATHLEHLLFLDVETFYPWDGSYSQPAESAPGSLLRRRNKGLAHPWAKDPRRCALRFLTVHDTEGTLGSDPLTIDLQACPELPGNVRKALATCTLVGHNLDFDLTVLRRHAIAVSGSVIDTMLASRLLGLGKEKFRVPSDIAYCDLDPEDLEELVSLEDPNPLNHDLATVVKRYLGIRMEKAHTKLGGSDWSRTDLSPAHYVYMAEDVGYLSALWTVLEQELREAQLEAPFRERMKFFPHLNQIKMAGIPIDISRRDADCQKITAEKAAVREELRVMFQDYRHPIPKSRLKTIRIKAENGRFQRVPGPTHEEFSPSNRDHVLGVLTQRGIPVENTQEATLKKLDTPECRLLLKYAAAKKRLEAIAGITRSTFSDARVRAAGWNQLSARTGRITSTEPNLQQVPRDWRTGFRVEAPKFWLKGDLSQIEMVLIAIVTGDRNLIELLRSGRDVYVEYGARIFGKKPECGPGDDQITDRLRGVAKVPTLGISYGLTPFGFVRQVQNELGIKYEIQEAQGFFETFFEMFPEIAAYQARAAEDALSLDRVCTIGGTRRWLPPLVEDRYGHYWPSFERRKKILINTPIQGSGADLVIWAVNRFMHELPEGVEIVNLVHDEVDAIVTRGTLKATVDVITRAFQETFAGFYPSSELVPKIKFSCGPSWGETVPIDGTGA